MPNFDVWQVGPLDAEAGVKQTVNYSAGAIAARAVEEVKSLEAIPLAGAVLVGVVLWKLSK